jgi:hypothetical protein
MVPETFADGIGRIGFSEGMVRIELVSVADQKDGQPVRQPCRRIVMTPQGFMQSVQAQLNLIRKLEEAGVIRRAPAQGGETAAAPAAANGAGPRSPNF